MHPGPRHAAHDASLGSPTRTDPPPQPRKDKQAPGLIGIEGIPCASVECKEDTCNWTGARDPAPRVPAGVERLARLRAGTTLLLRGRWCTLRASR
jgi:hypothetical protein